MLRHSYSFIFYIILGWEAEMPSRNHLATTDYKTAHIRQLKGRHLISEILDYRPAPQTPEMIKWNDFSFLYIMQRTKETGSEKQRNTFCVPKDLKRRWLSPIASACALSSNQPRNTSLPAYLRLDMNMIKHYTLMG